MTPVGFTAFDRALRDGRTVHLRAMRPDDEAELLQAFHRMSDDARYMRFMRAVREPDMDRVRKVLASFPEDGFGIVATVPAADGYDVAGSAIYILAPDRKACEFAIHVGSAFAGSGLARILLTALIAAATGCGLKEMEGFVLAANGRMLGLARSVGFTVDRDPDDPSVRICRLQLGGA
jgi:acetyltransferase